MSYHRIGCDCCDCSDIWNDPTIRVTVTGVSLENTCHESLLTDSRHTAMSGVNGVHEFAWSGAVGTTVCSESVRTRGNTNPLPGSGTEIQCDGMTGCSTNCVTLNQYDHINIAITGTSPLGTDCRIFKFIMELQETLGSSARAFSMEVDLSTGRNCVEPYPLFGEFFSNENTADGADIGVGGQAKISRVF